MKKTAIKNKKHVSSKVKIPKAITPEILDASIESDELNDENNDISPDNIVEGDYKVLDSDTHTISTELSLPNQDSGLTTTQFDLLKKYISDISKYPLLKPDEEYALAIKLKNSGDIDAARKLVTSNLRLVVKIAMEYRNAYQNVMDLIQEGNVGLMKAVSKFDPTKGAKLSYYSSWWIKSFILKYIIENFRLVRVGTTAAQKKLFFHLMREKEKLEAQGIDAQPKLLADLLHVKEKEIREMNQRLGSSGAEVSLNNPLNQGDGDSVFHLDMLADPNQNIEFDLENDELKQVLRTHLEEFKKTLKDKEKTVFEERLNAENPKTLQEVADKYGLTRERARQIESNVIDKMRNFYQKLL